MLNPRPQARKFLFIILIYGNTAFELLIKFHAKSPRKEGREGGSKNKKEEKKFLLWSTEVIDEAWVSSHNLQFC